MKKENYILAIGIIIFGFISSPYVLDPSNVIRHGAWCIITMILCTCLFLKKKNLSILHTALFLTFMIYCLITTLSIFKAANKSEALYAILVSWVTLIFFVCVAVVADKKTIIKWLVYMGLIFASYGLYDIARSGGAIGVMGLGFANGRNLWSSTLMLLLPFSLYAVFKDKNRLAILTSILLVVNIILLQTRSVYLGVVIASLVTLIAYRKKAVIIAILAIIICTFTFDRLRDTDSLGYRLQSWHRTIKTFCDEPILGVGAGNWKVAVPRYGNTFNYKHKGEQRTRQAHHQRAHNDFLEVLTETGIIGGLCYLSIFLLGIYYSTQARDQVLAWTMRFGIVSYMVFAFFSFPKERAIHTILVFMMIGLIMRNYHARKVWAEKNIKIFIFCAIILLFALFVNLKRYQAEAYTRKFLIAAKKKDWLEVDRMIDENYSPFATMVGFSVTPILQYRAEANFYLDNQAEAYADYLKAYDLHPNHAATLNNIADYKCREGDYEGALPFYERATKVHPAEFLKKALERTRKKAGK